MNEGLLTLGFLGGGPGTGEIIVIFLVILVLFGPRRLPEIARMIGKTLSDLRRASQEFKDQILRIDEAADELSEVVWQRGEEEENPYHEASGGPGEEPRGGPAPSAGETGSELPDDSRLAG